MRILKALNNINTLALALYIPYIALNFDSFFFGKNKDGGVILISIIMFLTTFICGGIIMIIANKRNVENDISFSEIKSIGKVIIILFITAGIMMAYLAWHGYYAVNTDLNTLEINKGILSFLGGKSVTISLDNIEFVKVKGFYLILMLDNDEIKINRFYSGMKKFEKTLDANGIPIKHN